MDGAGGAGGNCNSNHDFSNLQKGGSQEGTVSGGQEAHVEQEVEGKEDASKDGDPRALQPHPGEKIPSPHVGSGLPGAWGSWSNLFGIKPSGKSSFPKVIDKSDKAKGTFALEIPREIIDHNILSMANTLVGKFVGPRPNIDVVRSFTRGKWDLKGHVEVTAMAKGFMSFEFSCSEDFSRILCAGNWSLGRSNLILQKWTSNLDLNNDFQSQVPVWIRLPELPLEYWHEDVFDGIARTFGELLSIDPVTAAKKRLNYARICIGVKEGQDMPQVLEFQSRLGNRTQKVDYESVPFACFHCKKAGHKAGSCPLFKGKRLGGEAWPQGGKNDSLEPK